ncbi:major facilitator superfamily transporter protein [Diatrype stigma]|uniref:GPI ethanolamine phosphate transferase 2 n=1 Tax=Diatrype stigma TaxID=117547 RepID=A0AAN9UQZ5_9PEZI
MYRQHEHGLGHGRGPGFIPISTILLIVANLLIPAAILVFATGFFPYKPFLPGLAEYQSVVSGPPPEAPFDRVIFMVVDALRRLIANGVAMPYTAHATSPTITMPRIKAITTGSTPSFLDAILSFDEADTSSTLAAQDTWLAQMRAKGSGKLVMYGDDTWLKLFPGTFDRADGTSSFFVSDFTEVDNNVTRHVSGELRNDDWNTMVLHYLGLDHIGHKTGPRGPNMLPKQREMDGIVREIYEAMNTHPHLESTLLVLVGDHGMNDAGNHGASSPGETSAALTFVSPKLRAISRPVKAPADFVEDFQYYAVVEQSDLAPTLGALLGFPNPKNNLGAFIPDFLPFWPQREDQLHLLTQNAVQIFDIIAAAFGSSTNACRLQSRQCSQLPSTAGELAGEWALIEDAATAAFQAESPSSSESWDKWTSDVFKWLNKAQTLMTTMASNYDMNRLISGAMAATVALGAAIASLAMLSTVGTSGWLPFSLITVLYGVMMFASSYVEEEQHFWYWTTSAWLLSLGVKRFGTRPPGTIHRSALPVALLATAVFRVIRAWNQTGQKFAGEPDIVTMFLAPRPALLWCLVIASYSLVAGQLFRQLSIAGIPILVAGSLVSGLVLLTLSFKLAFTIEDAPELVVGFARSTADIFVPDGGPDLVTRARAVFIGLGLTALWPVVMLTVRPAAWTSKTCGSLEISVTVLLLQFAGFFAMGGNNAISGVDLSSAYNGISDFNVVAVGVLILVSNWAASVWWMSAGNLMLLAGREPSPADAAIPKESGKTTKDSGQSRDGQWNVWKQHVGLLTVFTAASLVAVMAACTALRTHLFIWTVFSPKYLYSMAWSLGVHLGVNIALGGLLFWLGSSR